MIIKELTNYLETYFPLAYAYDWDHCGLQVGSVERPVKKVMIALTPDIKVMEECIFHQVDLLITHHPLLFDPLYCINVEEGVGKVVNMALTHGITIYSYHTCMDRAPQLSMNKWLMEALGIFDSQEYGEDGLIKIAKINQTLEQLIAYVKEKLEISTVRYVGNLNQSLSHMALIGGSGADFIDELAQQVDVLITGDIKYHEAQNAISKGLCLIDIGHFAERIMVPRVKELIKDQFDLCVYESKQEDYFQFR